MNALIVEDIKAASDLIKGRVEKLAPSIGQIDQAYSIKEAYEMVTSNGYDILFLDVQLAEGTSFDLLKKLKEEDRISFEIIFITGQMDSEFLVNAIKFSAIDFLNKPLDDLALSTALEKALKKIDLLKYNLQIGLLLDLVGEKKPQNINRIAINLNKGLIKFFDVETINYLMADGVVTKIMMVDGREYSATKNLGFYKSFLVSQFNFYSISQSILINIDHLDKYSHSDLTVMMKNGQKVKASRRGGKEFKTLLENSTEDSLGIRAAIKKLFK